MRSITLSKRFVRLTSPILIDCLVRWGIICYCCEVMWVISEVYPLLDPWWRHPMEAISALLAVCAGNHRTGGYLSQSSVTLSLDVFFDLCLKRRRWFGTPSHHYDVTVMCHVSCQAQFCQWAHQSKVTWAPLSLNSWTIVTRTYLEDDWTINLISEQNYFLPNYVMSIMSPYIGCATVPTYYKLLNRPNLNLDARLLLHTNGPA